MSSIKAHLQKLVWELSMALCQNKSITTKSNKESKPLVTQLLRKPKPPAPTPFRRPKHFALRPKLPALSPYRRPKPFAPWPSGTQRPGKPPRLAHFQKSHGKSILHLEGQAIEEGEQESAWLPLHLSSCSMSQPCRTLSYASGLLSGVDRTVANVPSVQSLHKELPLLSRHPPPMAPYSPAPEPSLRSNQQHLSQDLVDVLPPAMATPQKNVTGPHSSKQQEVTSIYKVLTERHLETFKWDSLLVRETREDFRKHSPNFSMENTSDLFEVFRHMIMAAELLDSSIYEIKETWVGLDELWQGNYTVRTLPKGLKFLRAVPPSDSPKVMGLTGIHNLDTLCHFYRVTHCPWGGKVGQNKGTVINHLWSIHYRLGLVCKKCYGCPTTSSEAIHCHGQKGCQPSGGRCQWVILISVTASRRCTESLHSKWKYRQRI